MRVTDWPATWGVMITFGRSHKRLSARQRLGLRHVDGRRRRGDRLSAATKSSVTTSWPRATLMTIAPLGRARVAVRRSCLALLGERRGQNEDIDPRQNLIDGVGRQQLGNMRRLIHGNQSVAMIVVRNPLSTSASRRPLRPKPMMPIRCRAGRGRPADELALLLGRKYVGRLRSRPSAARSCGRRPGWPARPKRW